MAGKIGIAASTLAIAGLAHAAVIVDDKFIDGGATNGTDAADAGWIGVANVSSLGIVSNNTTGPDEGANDNALRFNPNNTFAGMGGVFSATTLAVGETMILSFDARFTSSSVGSNGAGFRFGLYNTNGGTAGTGSSGNDFGYIVRAAANSGNVSAPTLAKEVGGGAAILGGDDFLTLAKYSTTTSGLSTTSRAYSLSITRDTATSTLITFSIGGTSYSTASEGGSFDNGNRTKLASQSATVEPANGGAAYFTFDEIIIGTGNSSSNTFEVDNVKVEVVVPEPGSIAALGLLGLALGRRQRRR